MCVRAFCIRSVIGNRELSKFVYLIRCWLRNTEPALTHLLGMPLSSPTGTWQRGHLYFCYEKVKEAAVLFVCLLCIVSLLKYAVNCMGFCHVFVCSVPFGLLNFNRPKISDLNSLELKTLTFKIICINSNIILLAMRPMKIKVIQNGKGHIVARLGHCAMSRKVTHFIPGDVIVILHWHNSCGRIMALGVNSDSNSSMYQEHILWSNCGRCVGLTTLPPSCANCLEIWEPQPLGTFTACPGLYRDYFTCFGTE
jgi:hypothetical protein